MHHNILLQLGIGSVSVKSDQDLNLVDGLIIPGGESTTISLLVDSLGLRSSIIKFSKKYPVMGTCAGLIMMASEVSDSKVNPLGLLDISVDRNAYGRQIRSKIEKVDFIHLFWIFRSAFFSALYCCLVRFDSARHCGTTVRYGWVWFVTIRFGSLR